MMCCVLTPRHLWVCTIAEGKLMVLLVSMQYKHSLIDSDTAWWLHIQSNCDSTTTLAKKIVAAEIFMRLIRRAIMRIIEISCNIDFDLQRELVTRRYRESRWCQTEARYHMIELQINLMNFSAVTIFWPGYSSSFLAFHIFTLQRQVTGFADKETRRGSVICPSMSTLRGCSVIDWLGGKQMLS